MSEQQFSDSIQVEVKATYLPHESVPDQQRFVFSYDIAITNRGETRAQLLSRYWLITDAEQRHQEVRGEGVIGQQPLLAPGETYNYQSFVVLETQTGTMEGSYQFRDVEGHLFDAEIPRFALVPPFALH